MEATVKQTSGNLPSRVLVLDDDEHLCYLMRVMLERDGCEVKLVRNGRDGLKELLQDNYDVAVVDYFMPEMDGLTFAQEARKIWPWLGFVFCSGFSDSAFLEGARALGVTHILTKPVRMDELTGAVRDETERSRKQQVENPTHLSNTLQYQLKVMRKFTDSVLQNLRLPQALRQLTVALHDIVACDVVGVLGLENDKAYLYMQSRHPQPGTSFHSLHKEMLDRYTALVGRKLVLTGDQVEMVGRDEGMTTTISPRITCVPILARDQVIGILGIGSLGEDDLSTADTTFIYQASSQLATLLSAIGHIQEMATRDPLTDLWNRRYLLEALERSWLLSKRYMVPMAVMVLDLDNFKTINDTLGHAVGDRVLVEFSRLLTACSRRSDLLARLGGDEFVLVLPQARHGEAEELAERILTGMKKHVFRFEGKILPITTSIGIAESGDTQQIGSWRQLLECADFALYDAKTKKGNSKSIWTKKLENDRIRPVEEPEFEPVNYGKRTSANAQRILVLDDDQLIREMLGKMLKQDGFDVLLTGDVEEARKAFQQGTHIYDLFLTDLSSHAGDEIIVLLEEQWKRDPHMIAIVISGKVNTDLVINLMRRNVFDVIRKPFNREELMAQVHRALTHRKLLVENLQYQAQLEEMVHVKSEELGHTLEELQDAYSFTLESMVAMLDAREYQTARHCQRVTILTERLARQLGVEEPELTEICRGALLHDIGKISIPDRILHKPGPLNELEWEKIRQHPETGYSFLQNSPYLKTSAEIVRSHHESWDGNGYPRGLKGDQIIFGARIFSVIDSYDAMRSPRDYKAVVPMKEAVEEIRNQSGKQFDPRVVDAFLDIVPELEYLGQWPAGDEST